MGYHTNFEGSFQLDKPLHPIHLTFLKKFNETRRMKRDPFKLQYGSSFARLAGLESLGVEGGYYVEGAGFCGQDREDSIIDHNCPPAGQPSLWCQWTPNENGTKIVWDDGEKFYDYTKWIEYLIEHFLEPWGYKLNGEVFWFGEEDNDRGKIVIKDNVVEEIQGTVTVTYGEDEDEYVPEDDDETVESMTFTHPDMIRFLVEKIPTLPKETLAEFYETITGNTVVGVSNKLYHIELN